MFWYKYMNGIALYIRIVSWQIKYNAWSVISVQYILQLVHIFTISKIWLTGMLYLYIS